MKKLNRLFVATIGTALMSIAFCSGISSNNDASVVWGEMSLDSSYDFGSMIYVPEINVTVDGVKQTVAPEILFPSKKCIKKSSTQLDEVGKYRVLYQVVVNDKAYSKTYDFNVDTNLFTMGSASSASYGKPENALMHEGLVVELAQGDEILFNQPIDIANFTSDDFIVSGYIAPQKIGSYDFEKLLITLYDAENPDIWYRQHIRRRDISSSGVNREGCSYFYGGANGQGTAGANVKEADPQQVNKNNEWGPYAPLPFDGVYNVVYSVGGEEKAATFDIDSLHVDDYLFRLSMDMQGYEVYNTEYQRDRTGALIPAPGGISKHFITDLNNPNFYSTLFYGFPSGKVKVGIKADRYVKEKAKFVITDINGINLEDKLFIDNQGPSITISNPYGSTMPLAKTHLSYLAPDAYAFDDITGKCDVTKNVWFNYGTPRQTQISIIDDRFKTDKVGWYTIEYSAKDSFGNESKEILSVYCGNEIPELEVTVGEHKNNMFLGEKLIPANFRVANNSGAYSTSIAYIDPNGERYDNIEDVVVEVQGTWTVELTTTDMIGRENVTTYEVEASISDMPILEETDALPKAFVAGGLYELPIKSGRLYVGDYDYEYIDCDLVVTCGENQEEVYGEYIVENYLENGTLINCSYQFDGNIIESIDVPYVRSLDLDPTEEYPIIINYTNYFVGDGFDVSLSPIGSGKGVNAQVTAPNDKSTLFFANPVLADKVNLDFISDSKQLFPGFEVKLIDSKNPNQTLTTRVDIGLYNSTVIIGDQQEEISFAKANENMFSLSYGNGVLTINDDVKYPFAISNFDNGMAFDDFTSHKVYIEVSLIDAQLGASLNFLKINNHSLVNNGEPIDRTLPEIVEFGSNGGTFASGEVYESGTLISSDVIAPNTEASLTIKDPDSKSLGRDLDPSISYSIPLDKIGTYRFEYSVEELFINDDYAGDNVYEKNVRVYSVDYTAPEISLLSNMPTEAKVGDVITLSQFSVTDNYTPVENIVTARMIVAPNGLIYTIDDSITQLKVTMAGIYEIRYLAMDEQGNTATLTHQILVK